MNKPSKMLIVSVGDDAKARELAKLHKLKITDQWSFFGHPQIEVTGKRRDVLKFIEANGAGCIY